MHFLDSFKQETGEGLLYCGLRLDPPLYLNSRPPDATSDLPLTQRYLHDNRLTANTLHVKPERPDWKQQLKTEMTVDEQIGWMRDRILE